MNWLNIFIVKKGGNISMAYQPKSYRKFLAGTVTAAVVASAVAPAASAAETDFQDIKNLDAEAQSAINSLAAAGVIKGYDNGTKFDPFQNVKRGQVALMLSRVEQLGLDASADTETDFSDVSDEELVGPIEALVNAGIANGYQDGTFKPFNEIQRQHMAKFIVEAFDLELKGNIEDVNVTDLDLATEEMRPYIQILASHGITTQSEFKPNASVSRYAFSLFLQRAIDATTPAVELPAITIASEDSTHLLVTIEGDYADLTAEDFVFDGDLEVLEAEVVTEAAAEEVTEEDAPAEEVTTTTYRLTTSEQEAGKTYNLVEFMGVEVEAGTVDPIEVPATPEVKSVSAINGNSFDSISINESFRYVFNEELDESTVNGNTFQLLKGTAVTPVKVTLGEDKKTVTVEPTSNLSINSDYTLVVKTGVKNVDGVALASEYTKAFKTNNNAIATNLTLLNNSSSNIDTDVKADEVVVTTLANQLVVTYNGPLAFDAGSKSNVELVDAAGNAVAIDTVSASGSTLTVDLGDATKVLKNGTYTLKVKALQTADGRTVDAYTRSFSITDGTLSVLGTTLADGTALTGTKVYGKLATKYNATTGAVEKYGFKALVKLSVDVDPTTVNSNSIVLKKASNGEVVPATVIYNADSKTAAVVPNADLADLTDYQVVVSVGDAIKDKFGNKLKQVDPVSFKTDDTTAPSVVSASPANGSSSVDLDSSFSFTFDDAIDPTSLVLSSFAGPEATHGPAARTSASVFLKNETTNAYVDVDALFNVELSADKKTVTFKLKSGQTLPVSNSFTLSLRGGKDHTVVTDATAGDDTAVALADTYKYSFATNAGDEVGPTFVEAKQGTTVLANGAKSVNAAGNIEFYYNEAIKLPTAAQTGSLYSLKLNDGSTKSLGALKAATAVGAITAVDTATITVPDLDVAAPVGTVVKVTDDSTGNVYYRTVATAYADDAVSLVLNSGLPVELAAADTVELLPLQIVNNTTDKKYKVVVTLNAAGTDVASDKTYSLKLTDVFTDGTGNKAKEPTLAFTTGPAPVVSAASATQSTPFAFDTGFGVDETAFIQVSNDTDLTTVTDETLYFANADGTKAPYEIVAKSATTTALGDTTAVKGAFTNVDTIKIDDAATGGAPATANVTDVAAGDILFIGTDNVFVKVVEVTQGSGETTIKVDRKVSVSDDSVVTRVPAIMLQPKSGEKLNANTTYKLVVKDGIVDKAGNPMKATEFAFTTGSVAAGKLSIASSTIQDGATGVAVNAPLTITFNEEVKNSTLSDVIKIDASGDVTSQFTIKKDSTDPKKVIIEPKGFLVANTVYKVSVLATATSNTGDADKNLGTQKDYTFQTEASASVEPKITSAEYYELGATGVVGDVIRLTFNAPIDSSKVTVDGAEDFAFNGIGTETLGSATVAVSTDKKSVVITLDTDSVFVPGVSTIGINNTGTWAGSLADGVTELWADQMGNQFVTDKVSIVKK